MHTYTEIGVWFAKVTVKDGKGGTASALVKVTVTPLAGDNSQEVGVGGVVPGVLSLEIKGSANFGVFLPSVARDYTASLAATATSSATAAELTVRDPSTVSTGHLVNGGRALAHPVQVRATDADNPSTAYASVPENGGRLRLLAFPSTFSVRPITIGFKQTIDATEPPLTGGYGKTLVFTLSATTPREFVSPGGPTLRAGPLGARVILGRSEVRRCVSGEARYHEIRERVGAF